MRRPLHPLIGTKERFGRQKPAASEKAGSAVGESANVVADSGWCTTFTDPRPFVGMP